MSQYILSGSYFDLTMAAVSPIYNNPALADCRPPPSILIWTMIGIVVGTVFILVWIYALLFLHNSDTFQYKKVIQKLEAEAVAGFGLSAPLPKRVPICFKYPFARPRVNAA